MQKTTKTDKNKKTAWNYAVATGKADVIIALLPGVNLNQSDKNTALLTLAQNSAAEANAAQAIITNGADANAADANKITPLMYACGAGNKDMVNVLITNKADMRAKDTWGRRVITYTNDKDIIRIFLHKRIPNPALIIVGFDMNPYWNQKKKKYTATAEAVADWVCKTKKGTFQKITDYDSRKGTGKCLCHI